MINISEKLTQQDFQQILVSLYHQGQEVEVIKATEFIEEIKKQFMAVLINPNK